MSKGLKALEKLTNYKCSCMSEKIECRNIIEKELKALEIIKETPIFAYYITIYKSAYEMVSDVNGFRINNSIEELQVMFDLLKEVLQKGENDGK